MKQRELVRILPAVLALAVLPHGDGARCEEAALYCLLAPLEDAGATAVAVFDVTDSGALEQGLTYPTGGSGRAMSSGQDLEIDSSGQWLLATNNASNDITVFAVEADGALSTVPGSPFPAGVTPMEIAVHPTLPVFYVSHAGDNTIGTFTIGADGSLSPMQVTPVAGLPRDLAVEPRGRFLYVADMAQGAQGFAIAGDGSLTHLPDPAYGFPSSRPYEIEIDPITSQVLVLDLDAGLAVFAIEDTGALVLTPGSPVAVGGFAHTLALSGDARFAYAGRTFDGFIMGYELAPAGALPTPIDGSPFAASGSLTKLCASGTHLFAVLREAQTIHPFTIGPAGGLIPVDGATFAVQDPDGRVPNGALCRGSSMPVRFRRGDANADGSVDLADALFTMNHLFRGGAAPVCPDAADADDTEGLDIGDPIFLLNHLFRGGPRLQPPGSDACGPDPTPDALAECGYSPDLCAP